MIFHQSISSFRHNNNTDERVAKTNHVFICSVHDICSSLHAQKHQKICNCLYLNQQWPSSTSSRYSHPGRKPGRHPITLASEKVSTFVIMCYHIFPFVVSSQVVCHFPPLVLVVCKSFKIYHLYHCWCQHNDDQQTWILSSRIVPTISPKRHSLA